MREKYIRPSDSEEPQDELYRLMRTCGHILYHSGQSKNGQGRILHILDHQNGSVSQKEIQAQMGIQSGSISEVLGKLERDGLIVRYKDEDDRRKVIVSLTDSGREHAAAYHRSQREKDWFEALNETEKAELKALLEKLLASWNEGS